MELTNREAYFQTKRAIEKEALDISNNEICQLLEKANGFNSYTELTLNFDKKLANPEYFEELKSKLFSGEPIQYILNEAPFIDYTFYYAKKRREKHMELSILLAEQIIALFLMVILGFLLVKIHLLKVDDSDVLSKLVVFVFSPCVLIQSFTHTHFSISTLSGLLLAIFGAAIVHVIYIA